MERASVLIVDDDSLCLDALRNILEEDGYEVATSENSGEVLRLLESRADISLVLMDVLMPEIDGLELCRRLKKDHKTMHLPVILISGGSTEPEDLRAGFAAGADGYLTKPVEGIALRAWVKATLRICALQRELMTRPAAESASLEEVLKGFARLSHAVNNPLQSLYATMDILSLSMQGKPELMALSEEILGHAERVAQTVARASLQAKTLLHEMGVPPNGK